MTLYRWVPSLKAYERNVIYAVFWDSVKHSNTIKSGQVNIDSVFISIPSTSATALEITTGKDIVVKGSVDFEFDNTSEKTQLDSLKALKQIHDCFTVTSVDPKLYGSPNMQHYELSCK